MIGREKSIVNKQKEKQATYVGNVETEKERCNKVGRKRYKMKGDGERSIGDKQKGTEYLVKQCRDREERRDHTKNKQDLDEQNIKKEKSKRRVVGRSQR